MQGIAAEGDHRSAQAPARKTGETAATAESVPCHAPGAAPLSSPRGIVTEVRDFGPAREAGRARSAC
jgi:hypothetical protein